MKYKKFISLGVAIAISASTAFISQSLFTDTVAQINEIELDKETIISGSGFYTRKASVESNKKLYIDLQSKWSGLEDPYITRIWNYDNPDKSGNYFIQIENYSVNSSKFNNVNATFTSTLNKEKFCLELNKNYTSVFKTDKFVDQEYFAKFLVAVGREDGSEIKEYIEVGLKIKEGKWAWDPPVEAQWHIISRAPHKFDIEHFKKTLQEETELPELDDPSVDLPSEDDKENESNKPPIDNPENQPSNPEDDAQEPPSDKLEDEELENPEILEPPKQEPETPKVLLLD